MAFKDCIVTARDGGELTDEEAESLVRRFDELTARGHSSADAKASIIADLEMSARVHEARANGLRALQETNDPLLKSLPGLEHEGTLYERTWGRETDASPPELPRDAAVAAEIFHQTVTAGRRAEVPDEVVFTGLDALEPYHHLVPEGVRVGLLKSITPSRHAPDFVQAMFVLSDGTELPIFARYSKTFERVRGIDSPGENAILFLRFGGSGVEGNVAALGDKVAPVGRANFLRRQAELRRDFSDSLVGELLHELTHLYIRRGIIDLGTFGFLLGHARKLRVLDTEVNTYLHMIRRPESATARVGSTLLDAYKTHYSRFSNLGAAIAEEYVAHLVERAWHGGFTARELEPVRAFLEDIFAGAGETMARRLDDLDRNPRFAISGSRGRKEGEPDWAFNEASEEAWDDMAVRAHLIKQALERREQRPVHSRDIGGADVNARLFRDIARMEDRLLEEGNSISEVAAALQAHFKIPFKPEEIGAREVWWKDFQVGRGYRLAPEDEHAFAELYASGATKERRREWLGQALGLERPISEPTMQRLQQDLARRGLMELREPATRTWNLSEAEEQKYAAFYTATTSKERRLQRFRHITGNPRAADATMRRFEHHLAERGLITMRPRGGRTVEHEGALIKLTPEQERDLAQIYESAVPRARMLEQAGELLGLGEPIGNDAFMRRIRMLAERGLVQRRRRIDKLRMPEALAGLKRDDIGDLTPDEAAVLFGTRSRRSARVLTPEQEREFAKVYEQVPQKWIRLARLREIIGDPTVGAPTLKKVQRSLVERGLVEPRAPGGQKGHVLARLTPDQEREFAEVYRTTPSEPLRLARLREMTGSDVGVSTMRVIQRELAERGLLDLRPKGGVMGAAQEAVAKYLLPPDQAQAFAAVYKSGVSRNQRLEEFRRITGNDKASSSTMWRAERDLMKRGLIEPPHSVEVGSKSERRFALAGGRAEEQHLAESRRSKEVLRQMRQADHQDQWWQKQTAFMREGNGQPHNPVVDYLAAAKEDEFVSEVIRACRS